MSTTQERELRRVSGAIASAIVRFCRTRSTFTAAELREYVDNSAPMSAPASADRVLRNLRQRGIIDYQLTDRAGSRYKVTKA